MAKQYRPSFTEAQMILILEQTAKLDSLEGKKLHSYLTRFSRDIITGWKAPAFETTKVKISLEQSLGMEELTPAQKLELNLTSGDSVDSRRSKAVMKYTLNPSLCSKEEIEDVYNYKLIHGFSSKEEENKLELIVWSGI